MTVPTSAWNNNLKGKAKDHSMRKDRKKLKLPKTGCWFSKLTMLSQLISVH